MTSQTPPSPDLGDPFEDRLGNRIRGLADRGVRPIDAGAISRSAIADADRIRGGAGLAGRLGFGRPVGRLAWAIAGAALVGAVALGGASFAGGWLLGHGPTGGAGSANAPGSAPTPTAAAESSAGCALSDVSAAIVRWTGAAGSRIADVTVRNRGSNACSIATLDRPQLIDGHGAVLIDGSAPKAGGRLTIPAGGSASTEVEDSNYCGPAPVAPVSVAFVLPDGARLVAAPTSTGGTFGAAPCNGASEPASVTMHPWAR